MTRNPRVAVTVDPAECGAALAHACDEEQAAFVNAFISELVREARNHYNAQMQICWIQDRLSTQARDVLGVPPK
jgi:hypothetical protein